MTNITCSSCGSSVEAGQNFCGGCGKPVSGKVECPLCGKTVDDAKFCAQCGNDMRAADSEPQMRDNVWERGEDDFAMSVSPEDLDMSAADAIEVRHGTKALFFVEGRLEKIADSGRYPTREGGFLQKLFTGGKRVSAVLVDAGDVNLRFDIKKVRTQDGLFVDVGMDVVIKLEDANRFFVNVMKESKAFKTYELRQMLFSEVQNALQESVDVYAFNDLNASAATKDQLASRMTTHLRQTFDSSGFGFEQIRGVSIKQGALDKLGEDQAKTEEEIRKIKAETEGKVRTSQAQQAAAEGDRTIRTGEIEGKKEDGGLDIADKDVDIEIDKAKGDQDIKAQFIQTDLAEKRLGVYRKMREVKVERIKTDEEFRKFQQEVDREQVLDEAEWQQFKEELLWKEEDRQRDRRFLLAKIERQEKYELALIDLSSRHDLSLEEKKRQAEELELELDGELSRELKRIEGLARIDNAKLSAEVENKKIKEIGEKEVENKKVLMDLDLERQKFDQAIELDRKKFEEAIDQEEKKGELKLKIAKSEQEIKKLQIEEKRLKGEMGLALLEKTKAIKRKDKYENLVMELEAEQRRRGMRQQEEAAAHKRNIENKQVDSKVELDRMDALKGMELEQLIHLSDGANAAVLGDLAQSKTLKGMTSEEILAMKDPAALARALEERAKNTNSDELKDVYERMLSQSESAMGQVAQAHKDSADRAERMAKDAMMAMGGQQQQMVQAERASADRVERVSDRAMDRMGAVASTARASSGPEVGPGEPEKVQVCSQCKFEMGADKKFCPNCGTRV